jgi:hypothetical protein
LRFLVWGQGALKKGGDQENNNKFNVLVADSAPFWL